MFFKLMHRIAKFAITQTTVICIGKIFGVFSFIDFFTYLINNMNVFPEIVGFLKLVDEIQQLVRKRSQKNNQGVILHYISLLIYPLHFPKFCPIQKQ